MKTSTRIYICVRYRVIGVLNIIDGIDHIVRGHDSGGWTLKVLMWELQHPVLSKFIIDMQQNRKV